MVVLWCGADGGGGLDVVGRRRKVRRSSLWFLRTMFNGARHGWVTGSDGAGVRNGQAL